MVVVFSEGIAMITLRDRFMARCRQFRYRGYTIIATCTSEEDYYGMLFFPVVEIYKGRKYIKGKVLSQPLKEPNQNFKLEERAGKVLIDQLK